MPMFKRSWLRFIIASLIIVLTALLFYRFYVSKSEKAESPKGGVVQQSLGVKTQSPEELSSYQTATGVVPLSHWVTEEGVKVYYVHSPALPMVDIQVAFDAGSAREGEQGGLAYLTGQLLSDGAGNLDADAIAEGFDNVGAQFHAASHRDMAKVELRSLSANTQLLPSIKLLALVLSQPTFEEQDFKREQQNTLSALKQQSQMPQKIAAKAFYEQLYPEQPYANWIYGTPDTISALKTTDLKAFHKKYYVKKNAVVTIVGDMSLQDANAVAEYVTKDLPVGEKPQALPAPVPVKRSITTDITFPSTQTHILLGQIGIPQGDPDYYALYLGNHILGGGGLQSKLFKEIREDNGLAYSVYSYFQPMLIAGPFVMGCQTRNEAAEQALGLMMKILGEYIAKGPTEDELKEAKNNLLGGYALRFDSNASIADQITALGFYELPLDYFNRFKPAIEKLENSDIQAAFQKHLSPSDMVTIMVGQKAQQAA